MSEGSLNINPIYTNIEEKLLQFFDIIELYSHHHQQLHICNDYILNETNMVV